MPSLSTISLDDEDIDCIIAPFLCRHFFGNHIQPEQARREYSVVFYHDYTSLESGFDRGVLGRSIYVVCHRFASWLLKQ
jgi:hypothetical protein